MLDHIHKIISLKLANDIKTGDHGNMRYLYQNQHGNAIWFILLAVALLGFLTSVVSRSSSSVNQSGSVEQARIKASSILRFSKSIEKTVQQMILNGVSENDLDFLAISAAHDNTNCTTTECEVFNVEGGGIAYETPAGLLNDSTFTNIWHVSTGNQVYQFGCDTVNNSCTELLLLVEDIPKDVCLEINKIQGIANPSGDAPQQRWLLTGAAFTGPYSTTINADQIGGTDAINEAPQLKGKAAGCFYEFGSGSPKYNFYQILIAR